MRTTRAVRPARRLAGLRVPAGTTARCAAAGLSRRVATDLAWKTCGLAVAAGEGGLGKTQVLPREPAAATCGQALGKAVSFGLAGHERPNVAAIRRLDQPIP